MQFILLKCEKLYNVAEEVLHVLETVEAIRKTKRQKTPPGFCLFCFTHKVRSQKISKKG